MDGSHGPSESSSLHAALGNRLRRVADDRGGCSMHRAKSFCEEDLASCSETTMHRNSSIDNLLASGMINAGEGAYQFLAHSIRWAPPYIFLMLSYQFYLSLSPFKIQFLTDLLWVNSEIDLVELDNEDNAPVSKLPINAHIRRQYSLISTLESYRLREHAASQVGGQPDCAGGESYDRLDSWRSGAGCGSNATDKRWYTSKHFSRSKETMQPMRRSAQHLNLQSMQ
jgi:hypothetical protein